MGRSWLRGCGCGTVVGGQLCVVYVYVKMFMCLCMFLCMVTFMFCANVHLHVHVHRLSMPRRATSRHTKVCIKNPRCSCKNHPGTNKTDAPAADGCTTAPNTERDLTAHFTAGHDKTPHAEPAYHVAHFASLAAEVHPIPVASIISTHCSNRFRSSTRALANTAMHDLFQCLQKHHQQKCSVCVCLTNSDAQETCRKHCWSKLGGPRQGSQRHASTCKKSEGGFKEEGQMLHVWENGTLCQ